MNEYGLDIFMCKEEVGDDLRRKIQPFSTSWPYT